MVYKYVIHVTKEGASVLQSKEAAQHGGWIPPKGKGSLASRVMSAVNKCEPFIAEDEQEAQRVWEAEADAHPQLEKRRADLIKEGIIKENTQEFCKVEANMFAVSELLKKLREEFFEREIHLSRLQNAAYRGKEVTLPKDLAEKLMDVLNFKSREVEAEKVPVSATITCPAAQTVVHVELLPE